MAGETVLNGFNQTGGADNALRLGGTVLQADGTQAAAIGDPGEVIAENTAAIISILTVLRNTGIIAT